MTILILFFATFVFFLAVDFFALSYFIKPIFARDIGPLMLDELRLLPAFFFYAFLVAVVIWFVSLPAMSAGKSLWWVFGNAALLGAAAYGTYEFTNYAVLKDWTATLVVTDLCWGTVLTGGSAAFGVLVARYFA